MPRRRNPFSHPTRLILLAAVVLLSRGWSATNASSWIRLPWSTADGLPNNTVNGLAQTADGFIWLGTTPNGLARFDGVRFEEIPSTNFVESPNRGIQALSSGQRGGLHLGMDRGAIVSLYADRKEVFIPDSELSILMINSLTEDAQGDVWVSYRGGTVRRLENGRMILVGEEAGLPGGVEICSIVCEPDGRLWLFKRGQLGVWREGKIQTLQRLPGRSGRLAVARDGGVWACADFHLYKFKEGGALADLGSFQPRLSGTEVSVMLEGSDGILWIGTTFSGLYRYDGVSFEWVSTTHQEILSLLEDAEGNIWVGTAGGGLNQVRQRAVTLETSETGLPSPAVSSLCQDNDGVVWAATLNALSRYVGGRWQVLPTGTNWSGDAMSVCPDPKGGLWIGTRYNRLMRWQDGQFVDWGDPRLIKGQTIHTLLVATNGDLWIGEDSPVAIQRLRAGRLQDFEVSPEVRVIRACAQDAAGNIWFGSSKGDLLRVVGDRLVDETPRTIGAPQSIRCLYATPDGSLWIGFAGWGVGRIKNGRYSVVNARAGGLQDDYISQIIEDGRGWFWFGGDRGIFKVRQSELERVCNGLLPRVRSVQYGPAEYGLAEGQPSLQANFGNAPLALHSRDGRIWLSMRTALAVIDPDKVPRSSRPPPVLVTRVGVGDHTVAAYGGIQAAMPSYEGAVLNLAQEAVEVKVPPHHRRLTIDFTALSFTGTENILFRYRLDGFDDDWIETKPKALRTAVYPRLLKGDYKFQVQACNSEGFWNDYGATLAFVVTPFFWQTWWFQSVVVVAFTALIIAVVRYVSFRRLRAQLQTLEQQAALYKERARIAKDIHDDLGASLTQISLLGELAHQDRDAPEKVGDHINIISNTARRAVKSLDEIVWAVNPRNDTLAHFIDYTGQFALDYLRLAGVRCRLDLPEDVPARELSTDVRHNLFLVVKEAINNTVKYAHATELRLRIAVSAAKLELTVEDNGCGFEQPSGDGMDGLRNMRQRMADIGGQCWIQGRPGAGAKIALELPWPTDNN